jgi:hypothetical protein
MNEMHFKRFLGHKARFAKLLHKCYRHRHFMLHPSNFFAWNVDLGQSGANLEAFRLSCRVPDARIKSRNSGALTSFVGASEASA